MAMILPRGSILSIEATDVLANPPGTTKTFNKVTEHNRSDLGVSIERIEQVTRTSDGTLRKNYITDKRRFSASWTKLPSYRTQTVDGAWGAEDLRTFYLSNEGKTSFRIRINLAKNGADQTSSGYEEHTVVFGGCNFSVVKRGLQPHWNVSIELEEV